MLVVSPLADAGKGGKGGPPNSPPTIEGVPDSEAQVNQPYQFTPAANDSDGDPLSFSIANQPLWASFDPSSGGLSGTPADSDVGVSAGITISVSDGTATTSLPTFSIEVVAAAANQPPQIAGTPDTAVTADQTYSFRPTASDPDGDSLTFSIANKPSWATFNGNNGSLTGTPTDADVGVTASILISVSDGQAEAALPAFDIEVLGSGSASGTASLSWIPPSERTDGSALTNLAGYGIAYGKASRQYDQWINVDNPGVTSYLVEGLSDGAWYFAVYAYDADGLTSGFSNEGSKQIGGGKGPGGGKGKK